MKKPTHARAVYRPLGKQGNKTAKDTYTVEQIETAYAACRLMKFAAADSRRGMGWDLNTLLGCERLSLVALGEKTKAEVGL